MSEEAKPKSAVEVTQHAKKLKYKKVKENNVILLVFDTGDEKNPLFLWVDKELANPLRTGEVYHFHTKKSKNGKFDNLLGSFYTSDNQEVGSGPDLEASKELEIFRGQCLNIAATTLSNLPHNKDEDLAVLVFRRARVLFDVGLREGFLEWRPRS